MYRPADFFVAMRSFYEDRRQKDEYLFGLFRAAAAKIILPFVSAKSRPDSLEEFWPSPFAKEKEETAVVKMTAEERAASIRSLLDKVKLEDDGQEESQG
jgi:hypothetical protein